MSLRPLGHLSDDGTLAKVERSRKPARTAVPPSVVAAFAAKAVAGRHDTGVASRPLARRTVLPFLSVWLLAGVSWATDDDARVIRYRDDRVTVRAHDVPVRDILEELGHQSGADIKGEVRAPWSVSVDFDDVVLSEGVVLISGRS